MINKTFTNNGSPAYDSTGIALLDLFSTIGSVRSSFDENVIGDKLFNAILESEELAMKLVFYTRDPRGGYGERDSGRKLMSIAAELRPETFIQNMHLIPFFGRFDDLNFLFEHSNKEVAKTALQIFAKQLKKDCISDAPSIAAKWAPSENASSLQRRQFARILMREMHLTPKDYRKMLSKLRAKLELIETKLTERKYSLINYSKVPSLANKKYIKAFYRVDKDRFEQYIEAVTKGEAKINTSVLYPYDVLQAAGFEYSNYGGYILKNSSPATQVLWNNLPNCLPESDENILMLADTSTSMTSHNRLPIMNSLALAMYVSERSTGFWKDKVLGFSSDPKWYDLSKFSTIAEKIRYMDPVDGSTDLNKALEAVLTSITMFNAPVVDRIIVTTDMHFNSVGSDWRYRTTEETLVRIAREKFAKAGVKFPNIVFWNLNAERPVYETTNIPGFTYVSGYSPSMLKQVLSGRFKTPYEVMLEVLLQDRYSLITV